MPVVLTPQSLLYCPSFIFSKSLGLLSVCEHSIWAQNPFSKLNILPQNAVWRRWSPKLSNLIAINPADLLTLSVGLVAQVLVVGLVRRRLSERSPLSFLVHSQRVVRAWDLSHGSQQFACVRSRWMFLHIHAQLTCITYTGWTFIRWCWCEIIVVPFVLF